MSQAFHYIETHGEGGDATRPVLLLHRAGSSAKAWGQLLADLGDRRRMVAMDLPGHGAAPGPACESIEEMADVAAELLEQLDLGQALVVGHSMGGAVALSLALRRPALVSALLLVSSGARLRVATPLRDSVAHDFDALPDLMGSMVFSEQTPRAVVDRELSRMFDAPAEVVLADLEACHRFDAEPQLADLTVPVNMLTGKEDALTPPRLARRLAARTAATQLQIIAGAGHMLPQERPEAVAEAVLALTAPETNSGQGSGTVTVLLASRPVRVELDDGLLMTGLRERTEGFLVPEPPAPWLSVKLGRMRKQDDGPETVTVEPVGEAGAWRFAGPVSRGEVTPGTPTAAVGRVADDFALFQVLHLLLSMLLPRERALLLHADTVELHGLAYAFLGPSGTGKSTAAAQLAARPGAEPLAVDRTVLMLSAGAEPPRVATLPKLMRDEPFHVPPREVPLAGFLFPRPGRGVELQRLSRREALTRLLRSIIAPRGRGQPVAAALELADEALERVWAAGLAYGLGEDFSTVIEATRLQG